MLLVFLTTLAWSNARRTQLTVPPASVPAIGELHLPPIYSARSRRTDLVVHAASTTFLALDGSLSRNVSFSLDGVEIKKNTYPDDEQTQALFVLRGSGRAIIPPFDASIDTRQLPRLGWVVVATPDAIKKYGNELLSLSCYCLRYNIPLHIEHHMLVDGKPFFVARHRSLAKYLRYYQNVIFTDADSIIVDSTIDVRKWLDDDVDVVMQDQSVYPAST